LRGNMNGADSTKGIIMQEFNRRLVHLEECGSNKVNEVEIMVKLHDRAIENLTRLYEKGVWSVILLGFVGGANAIMNIIEFIKSFIIH